ncbi:MAG TPA: CpaF family protein [Solirubrobacterales bacterium]|jgi:pilus assembly protein CpaF|nr:CpaF family protein [Solirubrobacterales bacterium]
MATRERHLADLADELRLRLIERRRVAAASGGSTAVELPDEVRALVDEEAALLDPATRAAVSTRIVRDTVGLGPLEDLLADPSVEEVMVNGPDEIYVERAGRIEQVDVCFPDEEELRNAIERILAPLGRRIDELSPMVDARLADGSRVNVVIPPLAVDGPALSIRRFGASRPVMRELVERGSLSASQCELLGQAVADRRSILVSGGTGAGKTTLLNALSGFIDSGERIVTIEDAAELRLQQRHVVRLESRPASVEGKGEVTVRDLLRNALRMRPDRIVIGEVRGPEALDLLTALNTGHEGALSTLHANSAADALGRLETLALMAGVGLPHEAIAEQVQRGVDLVVQVERRPDGSRRVAEIAEVVRVAGTTAVRALAPG